MVGDMQKFTAEEREGKIRMFITHGCQFVSDIGGKTICQEGAKCESIKGLEENGKALPST